MTTAFMATAYCGCVNLILMYRLGTYSSSHSPFSFLKKKKPNKANNILLDEKYELSNPSLLWRLCSCKLISGCYVNLYKFASSKELWAVVMLVTPCRVSAKSNRLLAVAECCSIQKLACYSLIESTF